MFAARVAETKKRTNSRQGRFSSSSAPAAPLLQAKLRIGSSNDPLEHEADRMADAILSASTSSAPGHGANAGLQRKCKECEDENEHPQRTTIASEGQPMNARANL